MPPADNEAARLRRLLAACRRGLNHDLTNQLVALQGLLQLLDQEEADSLSTNGRDYLRRLLGVGQRTQALARTLRDLARLGGDLPRRELVALPEVLEDVASQVKPPLACVCDWEAPRIFAPRELVQAAVSVAIPLLAELNARPGAALEFHSRLAGDAVELTVRMGPGDGTAPLTPPSAAMTADLPGTWHDRLECVLLRELAGGWGGQVRWQRDAAGAAVTLTLPTPP